MFEVNNVYANRKGKYTVLAINPPKMSVQYEDGTLADLNIDIQERIWVNIVAEQEARAASRSARLIQKGGSTRYFIKVVNIPALGDLAFPGWQERVVMASKIIDPTGEAEIRQGDRLIYYAVETQTFFAVVTITGPAAEADPKDYFFNLDAESAFFFPVDVDAAALTLEGGVAVDSVELESLPNFRKMRLEPESFLRISEDDFELLAELLTEVSEDETEELEEDEEYEEEDEE